MAPVRYDKKPEVGDLIDINRGSYHHWAVYVGDGCVVHLAPPCEAPGGQSASVMSVLTDRALVKKEELWVVVGNDKWKINNILDDKYEPRPGHIIAKEACALVGQEWPYCVIRGNCEHFVTELRYGKAESRQVSASGPDCRGRGCGGCGGCGGSGRTSVWRQQEGKQKHKVILKVSAQTKHHLWRLNTGSTPFAHQQLSLSLFYIFFSGAYFSIKMVGN
ncbi:unnamed protein product [Tetraodon nigroviridis]|uniref:(spotted green pufferfish) hypothetical protein n=1 Tax=Tetraodon nigroviridis TaxID=99883 RepID=Q4RPC7_TETNG|nr:unnamed protein product [Tetraodon nigroviridis]